MRSISISPTGTITFIWTDDFAGLVDEGRTEIKRASHVEPNEDGQWVADLSPVDGPTFGPYPLRQEALDAETEYLEARLAGAA